VSKISRIERSNELLAEATKDQEVVKPLPNFHTEMVRHAPLIKNIKENYNDLLKIEEKSPVKTFLEKQARDSLIVVETRMRSLARGLPNEEPLDQSLRKFGVLRFLFSKFSSGRLAIKPGTDLRKVFFPVKGQNWFYLTAKEIVDPLPAYLLDNLKEFSISVLATVRELLKPYFDGAKDDPKNMKILEKQQFRVVGPYGWIESLKTLSGIPLEKASKTICGNIHDFINTALCVAHAFPLQGTMPIDFFQKFNKKFEFSRFDMKSPRDALLEQGITIEDTHVNKMIILLGCTLPSKTVEAMKLRIVTQHYEKLLNKAYLSEPKNEAEIQGIRKTLLGELEFTKFDLGVPEPWFLQSIEARKEKVEKFLPRVSGIIDIPKLKTVAYGQPLSTPSAFAKAFINALERHPEHKIIAGSVSSYIRSFSDPKIADEAVKRMHAVLDSGEVSIPLDEDQVGDLAEFIAKGGGEDIFSFKEINED